MYTPRATHLKNQKIYILAIIFVVLVAFSTLFIVHKVIASKPIALPTPTLKALAANHNLAIGNFAIPSRLGEKQYSTILSNEFDFALLDNQPNWHFTDHSLRPTADTYDFSRIDEVVNYAEKHNMPVQAHHYVWGEEKWLPDWLKKGNYSKNELLDLIRAHITTVGQRYSGRIAEWTVVNEAFSRGSHIYGLHDWWADATGDQEYIDKSFIWARQADPKSKLILNDFGNEKMNDISNAMYDYIKSAKARGVPIDGLGMQMHIDGTHTPTKEEVIANMKRFGELGIDVYVTEFDVNMNDLPVGPEEKDRVQANIYYDMTRACIESGVCHSFAQLGITDKETWYTYMGIPDARPLMFDKNYRPKPAYYSFRNALTVQ